MPEPTEPTRAEVWLDRAVFLALVWLAASIAVGAVLVWLS